MAAFPLMLPGTSRPPKLVVFDLDHTLIACDATILWTEFLYEKKIVTDPIWRQYDRDMVKSYAKGVLDIRDFCRKHAGAFRSIPEEKLHALAQEFAKKKIAPLIFPDGKKWAKNALQANIPACVLSASAAFIVKPIAKLFGLTDAMGIELAFKDGFCTGEIVGIPTFQEGKVERLSQRLDEAGIGFEDVLFFTDSNVPWWDSFTTALSVIALWMLAHKYVEQWLVWIVIDVACCGIYVYKGLYFTAFLYGFYAVVAIFGYLKWKKMMQ